MVALGRAPEDPEALQEPDSLGLDDSAAFSSCDLGHIISPILALVVLPIEWV